jgi:hypothetical protein
MLELVEFACSKNRWGLAWIKTFLRPWATSASESWHRLLAPLGLAGETRGSSQLGETSRFRKGLACVPTPADLLEELGRVARLSVRRALLIVRAFLRQSAVSLAIPPGGTAEKYRLAAQAVGVLLTPAALMAAVLGLWGIAADLHWTSNFVILTGPFSHWEVWLGVAALLEAFEFVLNRIAQRATRY